MFEFIMVSIVGFLFLVLGYLIWKKEKITLIHSYHYTKVKKEDIPAYTTLMGKGLCIMGIGMLLSGIIELKTGLDNGYMAIIISFILGIGTIVKAQYKYNGGIF